MLDEQFCTAIGSQESVKDFLTMPKMMRERNYFAAMMVNEGDADGLVTGHPKVIHQWLPMLQLVDKAVELR
jgi:phosphotransacetylase